MINIVEWIENMLEPRGDSFFFTQRINADAIINDRKYESEFKSILDRILLLLMIIYANMYLEKYFYIGRELGVYWNFMFADWMIRISPFTWCFSKKKTVR